jgi:hypothetical protein
MEPSGGHGDGSNSVENDIGDDMGDNSSQSGSGNDSDVDKMVDTYLTARKGRTFEEAMYENISTISEFMEGLRYQVQFWDDGMLQTLEREGVSFLWLAKTCLSKERQMKSTRGTSPTTWEKSTSNTMFYRSRPKQSDEDS